MDLKAGSGKAKMVHLNFKVNHVDGAEQSILHVVPFPSSSTVLVLLYLFYLPYTAGGRRLNADEVGEKENPPQQVSNCKSQLQPVTLDRNSGSLNYVLFYESTATLRESVYNTYQSLQI